MKQKKISRRDFMRGAAVAGAGLALGGVLGPRALARLRAGDQAAIDRAMRDLKMSGLSDEEVQAIVRAYMLSGPPQPASSRVVHVHDADATNWDFQTGWYGDHVDQAVVNQMVDQGVMQLTNTSTVADAWHALFPSYVAGETIAIKVNFNNANNCLDGDNVIDALIQPINAVVRGLKQIGVAEPDVWIYDAVRPIPNRFQNGCLYNLQFFGSGCAQPAGWSSDAPSAIVHFSPPSGVPALADQRVSDVVVAATYLINIPILKKHGGPGPSLSFKNHLGTINVPNALHDYIIPPWGSYFRSDYNPMVDIYLNPNIAGKTRLTIADGLFGSRDGWGAVPSRWATFGDDSPNSILMSTDPVAIDCVMYDLLEAETDLVAGGDYYLPLATNAGLGVFEHGDPWGAGYSQIDYAKIEI